MDSFVPVMNESMNEMIYEMNSTLKCGFKIKSSYDPRSPEIFRLPCPIAKIAFITARIIPPLYFISPVQYMIHFIYHFVHMLCIMHALSEISPNLLSQIG